MIREQKWFEDVIKYYAEYEQRTLDLLDRDTSVKKRVLEKSLDKDGNECKPEPCVLIGKAFGCLTNQVDNVDEEYLENLNNFLETRATLNNSINKPVVFDLVTRSTDDLYRLMSRKAKMLADAEGFFRGLNLGRGTQEASHTDNAGNSQVQLLYPDLMTWFEEQTRASKYSLDADKILNNYLRGENLTKIFDCTKLVSEKWPEGEYAHGEAFFDLSKVACHFSFSPASMNDYRDPVKWGDWQSNTEAVPLGQLNPAVWQRTSLKNRVP